MVKRILRKTRNLLLDFIFIGIPGFLFFYGACWIMNVIFKVLGV